MTKRSSDYLFLEGFVLGWELSHLRGRKHFFCWFPLWFIITQLTKWLLIFYPLRVNFWVWFSSYHHYWTCRLINTLNGRCFHKVILTFVLQMDPGQDLLLAALSESGICPNDIGLFDVDSQDVAQPSTTQQVRWSLVFVLMEKLLFRHLYIC